MILSGTPDRFGIALAAEAVIFPILFLYFFTTDNHLNPTLQISITALIAVGMTFVILTRELS